MTDHPNTESDKDSRDDPADLQKRFAEATKKPNSLKLEFSKASDRSRINDAVEPEKLGLIDPHGFVAKRLQDDFNAAVDNGSAAFLSDEHDDVRGLLFAYHYPEYQDDIPVLGTHEYTEFGTALSYMPGFGSAKLIMAALVLKEWWHNHPSEKIVNEIENINGPSITTYRDQLKWEAIDDHDEREKLFDICYKNVDEDCGNGIGMPPPDSKKPGKTFFGFTDQALQVHAQILLTYMDMGGIVNKKTGDLIPVDFSELDDIGLTRPRLEAMADGMNDRDVLRAIVPPNSGVQSKPPKPS